MDSRNTESTGLISPWESASDNKLNIENELQKELCEKHILFGVKAETIGKRVDRDDYLFFLPDYAYRFAVVHLTWSGRTEKDEHWPSTRVYSDFEEWKVKCMVKDYLDYADETNTFKAIRANRRTGTEVALFGDNNPIIKPGNYIMSTLNTDVVFKVKGIEVLNYIDKSQNHINPWIIVESNKLLPEDLINTEFYIIS
jgi:hypothetical protein